MNLRWDRGSASIEMAIVAPAVLALFATAIIGGRVNEARQAIEAAAFDAARTASLARDFATAQSDALAAADATLDAQQLHCTTLTVTVYPASAFDVPVGQPAAINAEISCVVSFADVALPGMPGSSPPLTATFTSPLDTYRSRG